MGTDETNGEGWDDEMEDGEDLDEQDLVTFVDENGVEATFAILMIVEFEGSDYAVLAPLAELEDDAVEEVELLISAYSENEEGEPQFTDVEDDALYEKLQTYCATLLEQEEEEEE